MGGDGSAPVTPFCGKELRQMFSFDVGLKRDSVVPSYTYLLEDTSQNFILY